MKRTIVHIIDSMKKGGKEKQLLFLIKKQCEHYNIILIIENNEVLFNEIFELPIQVIILHFKRKSFEFQKLLFQIIKRNDAALLHCWDVVSVISSIPNSLLLNVPIVNGCIRGSAVVKKISLRYLYYKIGFLFSHQIVSNSMAGLAVWKLKLGKKVNCIHNGYIFPEKSFSVTPELTESLPDGFCVGMVSNFRIGKDYHTFIKGAVLLAMEYKNLAFIAVGDGPLFKSIKKLIPAELSDRIILTGQLKDPYAIIKSFHIGVMLSFDCEEHGEGISNSIMEYMSLRKPVITSASGGNLEIVTSGVNGVVIREKNVNDFINGVKLLMEDEHLRISYGENGYERLTKDFSVDSMFLRYEKVYNDVFMRKN